MRRILWLVMGWLVWVGAAQAASFDCAKASTKVEHLICDNPEISKLDEDLNAAYKAALRDKAQADSIKQAQKQWVKERNGCKDVDCVLSAYKVRIHALTVSDDGGKKAHLSQLSNPAATNVPMGGKYKMIDDTFDIPQPNGLSKVEKHAEVCTAFLKNLEASPPYPPMACDVTFRPEFTDFKTPDWQDMDVWENRDLELQMSPQPKSEAEKEFRLKNTRDLIKAGMLAHRIARFDIDNDGIPDQVLARIDSGMCDAKKYADERYWRNYEVYDPVNRKVDLQKSKFYGSYWGTTSVFSYKGITYYASFGGSTNEPYFGKNDHAQKWYIRLYRPLPMEQGLRTALKQSVALGCEYLYLPPQNQGGN